MIEINRAGSLYIFRVNQYNQRVIEFRRTKAYAHWKPLVTYASAEEARQALWQLERAQRAPEVRETNE